MRRLAAAVLILCVTAAAQGQVSLWKSGGAAGEAGGPTGTRGVKANLVRDVRSRGFELHEIISVIVNVSADASTDEEANLEKKDSKNNLAINQYLKLRSDGLGLNLKGEKPAK